MCYASSSLPRSLKNPYSPSQQIQTIMKTITISHALKQGSASMQIWGKEI